jgi:hypothetical protein
MVNKERLNMKTQHYLAVFIKLFALILFLYFLKEFLFVIQLGLENIWYELISFSIGMVASILLWMFPLTVSKTIVKPEINKEINPIGAKEFLTLLVITLGLFTLFYAISDTVYWVLVYKIMEGEIPSGVVAENTANMIATAVELLLSLLLITKSKNIVSYLLSTVRVL